MSPVSKSNGNQLMKLKGGVKRRRIEENNGKPIKRSKIEEVNFDDDSDEELDKLVQSSMEQKKENATAEKEKTVAEKAEKTKLTKKEQMLYLLKKMHEKEDDGVFNRLDYCVTFEEVRSFWEEEADEEDEKEEEEEEEEEYDPFLDETPWLRD